MSETEVAKIEAYVQYCFHYVAPRDIEIDEDDAVTALVDPVSGVARRAYVGQADAILMAANAMFGA